MKSGYTTSEFAVTIISSLVGLLVAGGLIEPANANALSNAIVTIIGAIIAVLPAASYILSRTWLKSKQPVVVEPAVPVVTPVEPVQQ